MVPSAITSKPRKKLGDSISEEVYHARRVALVVVRDWEGRVLIMAHSPHLLSCSFGCLSVLWTEIQSMSEKRSMTLLGGPVRTPSRCFVFNKYKTPPNSSESHQQVPQDRAFTQTRSQIRTFSVVCGKDNVVIILNDYPFHAVKACFWYYLGSLQQRFKLDLK